MSEMRKSGFEARTLLALAWPISAAQLALMFLNLVDTADMYSRWVPGHQGGESASSWPGNQSEGPDRPLFKGSRLRVVAPDP